MKYYKSSRKIIKKYAQIKKKKKKRRRTLFYEVVKIITCKKHQSHISEKNTCLCGHPRELEIIKHGQYFKKGFH